MPRPNKNSADYFTHDADMRNDIKVKALRRKFGHKGYAVWNYILETLTDSEDFFVDYNKLGKELMAADFDVSVDELEDVVSYCCEINLLQLTDDDRLFSAAHQRRFENMLIKRERRRNVNRLNGLKGGNPNFQKGKRNPYYQGAEHNREITQKTEKITEDNLKENREEEMRIEENKGEKKKDIEYPYQDIVRLWNETCLTLPKVKTLNDSRRTKIRCRLTEGGCKTKEDMLSWARDIFTMCEQSDFLRGGNSSNWTATFDWVFENSTNWVKVSEGNYANTRGSNKGRTGIQNSLGVGEYVTADGKRTYGSGRADIPMSAPPRPSDRHQWSAESQNWILL